MIEDKITNHIVALLKNYNNPETQKPFEIGKDCQIVVKNGQVIISIEINPM